MITGLVKMASESAKVNAAKAALLLAKPGMCIGLGTGSTSELFVKLLAKSNIKNLTCIPTSLKTADLAHSLGLRVIGFDAAHKIDLAVDGADAVDGHFNLLKGMGGALTREKIVAYRAEKFAVIVDESKMKRQLGGIVPVEALPFAFSAVARELASCASSPPKMRKKPDNTPFRTDSGNYLLDVPIAKISDAAKLEKEINALPGVVENGIFTRADLVIVGNETKSRTLSNKKKFSFPYFLRRRA
jgi:ribose 5-phosphate isomerase A